jgi:hypothetical protein
MFDALDKSIRGGACIDRRRCRSIDEISRRWMRAR